MQVVAEPLLLPLSFASSCCLFYFIFRSQLVTPNSISLLITISNRSELTGFLCNSYLRRCDIVGSGNPECFGINPNSSEIHRCCSNPDQGQPDDGCFAEWPKGAKPATFNVCCTPGIRYGWSACFYLLCCCPAVVDSFGTPLDYLTTPLHSDIQGCCQATVP
jgi:hypothetical protein